MIKEEGKVGISAKVIADSVSSDNHRITTFELQYPRFIHSEFMTHRLISRNSASSRAIPVEKMLKNISDSMAMPLHWGKNKSGMQADQQWDEKVSDPIEPSYTPNGAGDLLENKLTPESAWRNACSYAVQWARSFSVAGYHKQVVNRLTEPFQMMKVVATATEWDNFFWLRRHKDAQPEIQELANCMWEALQKSTPEKLKSGEWHLPYVKKEDNLTLEEALKVSSSCCAQVSYRSLDTSVEKAIKIYDALVNSKPVHCFDKETEVLTENGWKLWGDVNDKDLLADIDQYTGELKGFEYPLELIKSYYTGEMFKIDNGKVSFSVTEGHRILGWFGKSSRNPSGDMSVYKCNDLNKMGREYGLCQTRVMTAPVVADNSNYLGRLIGFYIGDGFVIDNTIGFHLKKKRKVEYIKEVLGGIGLDFSSRKNKGGTTSIRVYRHRIVDEIMSKCGKSTAEKGIGDWSTYLYPSIFDGLKNSDGSVKRNTWTFSTTSKKLKQDFMDKAALAGLSVKENKPQRGGFRFMVRSNNMAMINDSRTKNSFVEKVPVQDEQVFCATMPSGGLLVRRNGCTLISGNSSPFEHQAKVMMRSIDPGECEWPVWEQGVTHSDVNSDFWSGNFKGFIQHRQLITDNTCWEYEYED